MTLGPTIVGVTMCALVGVPMVPAMIDHLRAHRIAPALAVAGAFFVATWAAAAIVYQYVQP